MEVMRLWGLVPDSIGGVETVFGLVRADFWVCTMLCVTLRAPHQEESRIVRRDSAIFPWVDAVLAVRICPQCAVWRCESLGICPQCARYGAPRMVLCRGYAVSFGA